MGEEHEFTCICRLNSKPIPKLGLSKIITKLSELEGRRGKMFSYYKMPVESGNEDSQKFRLNLIYIRPRAPKCYRYIFETFLFFFSVVLNALF